MKIVFFVFLPFWYWCWAIFQVWKLNSNIVAKHPGWTVESEQGNSTGCLVCLFAYYNKFQFWILDVLPIALDKTIQIYSTRFPVIHGSILVRLSECSYFVTWSQPQLDACMHEEYGLMECTRLLGGFIAFLAVPESIGFWWHTVNCQSSESGHSLGSMNEWANECVVIDCRHALIDWTITIMARPMFTPAWWGFSIWITCSSVNVSRVCLGKNWGHTVCSHCWLSFIYWPNSSSVPFRLERLTCLLSATLFSFHCLRCVDVNTILCMAQHILAILCVGPSENLLDCLWLIG